MDCLQSWGKRSGEGEEWHPASVATLSIEADSLTGTFPPDRGYEKTFTKIDKITTEILHYTSLLIATSIE